MSCLYMASKINNNEMKHDWYDITLYGSGLRHIIMSISFQSVLCGYEVIT